MNAITQFFYDTDKLSRSGKHQSSIFASRARQLVANSFEKNKDTGEFEPRENADPAKVEVVNKLVAMGAIEAVYGKGRIHLH